MTYNPGGCVGSTYSYPYWSGGFSTKGLGSTFNHAGAGVFNPATIATIASMETLWNDSATTAESSNCSPCNQSGVGICQVGQDMFNQWNSFLGGGYTWCSSICGTNYANNIQICADFLVTAFFKLQALGYTNSVEMMAMAATAWNGHTCGYDSNALFYPWGTSHTGYYMPGPSQITQYGASAGYSFQNSGYFGSGVFDTSISLT